MKTYIKFITLLFLKSFFFVFFDFKFVAILNILSELDFFKNLFEYKVYYITGFTKFSFLYF